MKAEELIFVLQKQIDFLKRNSGEEIGGFALLVAPDCPVIEFMTIGSHEDQKTFFSSLKDRMALCLEMNSYGGVNVPGSKRY